MTKTILFFFFSFSLQLLFSQKDNGYLKTTIIKDSRIDILNKNYKSSFKLKGYRIQIHSTNTRPPANQARAYFLKNYSKVKTHLNYEQPYYKVRIGDFKTKLEALKYKKMISRKFPNSFIVYDIIDIK